jgi:hypothetical protein
MHLIADGKELAFIPSLAVMPKHLPNWAGKRIDEHHPLPLVFRQFAAGTVPKQGYENLLIIHRKNQC